MTAHHDRTEPHGPWSALARLVTRHPRAVVATVVALTLVAVVAAALGLRIRPGYVDLLDPDSPSQARYLDLLEDFGNVEALHVLAASDEPGAAGAFVDAFADDLRRADSDGEPLVADVLERMDLEWFVERAPAWLPPGTAASLAAADSLPTAVSSPTADRVLALLDELVEEGAQAAQAARASQTGGAGGGVSADVLVQVLDLHSAAARGEAPSVAARVRALAGSTGGGLDTEGRIVLPDGRHLVTVSPADTRNDYEVMRRFLDAVNAAAASAREAAGARVDVAMTGAPVLLVNEMEASRRDVLRSTLLALVLVATLFLTSFHARRHVAAAVAALLCGLGLTFGAALLLVGSLNLFSVVFAAVLVGLGIDFGVHVVNHHEALLRGGAPPLEAVRRTLPAVGPPTAVGAITTAAAFYSTVASDFQGFSQLGLIAGTGVLICLVTALTFLPSLLVIAAPSETPARIRRTQHPWSRRLLAAPLRRPGITLGLSLALLTGTLLGVAGLRFDYDILNLQPEGTEAVALAKGEEGRAVSTHFGYSVAPSLAEARQRGEAFERLSGVRAARSAADFLPPATAVEPAGLAALADAATRAPRVASGGGEGEGIDLDATRRRLEALENRVIDLQDAAFEADERAAFAELDRVLESLASLSEALEEPGAAAGLEALGRELQELLDTMVSRLPELAADPLAPADLPPALASRFVGADGDLAVVIEPARPIWEREALEAFVASLRSIDPDVTGPPVQVLEVTKTMWHSLQVASLTALVAIVVIVAVSLRSLRGLVLALAPLLSGFVIMLGLLSWLDVPLNPANLVALPLILGIGVDHAVHVAHRWLVERDVVAAVEGVGHAIVVTSLTTLAGFSGLLIASHRGVQSLGVVACIGTAAMLFTSIVALPAALGVIERRRSIETRP